MALSAPEGAKLVNILELGRRTPYEGERGAAALAADRMLQSRGLTWDDVIAEPETVRRRTVLPAGWRADLAFASHHASFCRPWEQNFLRSIASKSTLSTKQRVTLTEIADALRGRVLV